MDATQQQAARRMIAAGHRLPLPRMAIEVLADRAAAGSAYRTGAEWAAFRLGWLEAFQGRPREPWSLASETLGAAYRDGYEAGAVGVTVCHVAGADGWSRIGPFPARAQTGPVQEQLEAEGCEALAERAGDGWIVRYRLLPEAEFAPDPVTDIEPWEA